MKAIRLGGKPELMVPKLRSELETEIDLGRYSDSAIEWLALCQKGRTPMPQCRCLIRSFPDDGKAEGGD